MRLLFITEKEHHKRAIHVLDLSTLKESMLETNLMAFPPN